MKRNKNYFIIRIIVILLGGAMPLASCEKNGNAEDVPVTGDGTCRLLPPTVTIEPFGTGSSATRAGEEAEPEEQRFNTGVELGNILTIENMPEADSPATRAFASGTYYRMVVYKEADWTSGAMTIAAQRLCKTGFTDYYDTSGTIISDPVMLGMGSYKVVCYSFNKTDVTIPELGAASVTVNNGDDFLSAVTDLTITGGNLGTNVTLPATALVHRCCKITGTLTAEYFDDNTISAASLSVTAALPANGTWNIKTTTMSVSSGSSSQTLSISLSKVNNSKYSGSTIVLPLGSQVLKATYSIKPVSASAPVSASNKSLSSSNTTFTPGSNHTFTIKALGAYVLTLPGPATIGGVKWAATNLGHNKTLESAPWISGLWDGSSVPLESGALSNDSRNDYWRWNVLDVDLSGDYPDLPPSSGTTWESSKDPCRQGLGVTWRVPTKENLESLVGTKLSNKKVIINNEGPKQTNGNGWLAANGTRASGVVFANTPSNVLFLPATGRRYSSNYQALGTFGAYWSSTLNESRTNTAYFLDFYSFSCSVIDRNRTSGFSLRCVQD